MIQKNEKILLSIIIGYFLVVFSIIILGFIIASQISEPMPIETITIFENGTTKQNVAYTNELSISVSFIAGFSNFLFIIPLILAGMGLWLPGIAIIFGQFPLHETSILVLTFWILSMVSIPITIKFSKGIPLWRRIPYIYLVAVLISGTAIWLWTGLGN